MVLAWAALFSCLLLPAVRFRYGDVIHCWKVGLASISELPPLDKTIDDVLQFVTGLENVVIAFSPLALYILRRCDCNKTQIIVAGAHSPAL